MDKQKQLIILVLGILLIVALSVVVVFEINSQKQEEERLVDNTYVPANNDNNDVNPTDDDFEETEFRQHVPEGVKVPSAGEIIPDELKDIVAVPKEELVSPIGEDISFRNFDVRAEGGKFYPSQIIVNHKDILQINITAIDKDYDFILEYYGMKQTVKKGETKKISFEAYEHGRFMYYCNICGGLETSTKGEVIVVK